MSIWSSLFSSGDTISKATDAIISAGDKLVYTSEERADMNLKLREQHIKILQAYHPFKITQRFLAIWYSFLFGVGFLISLGISVFNVIQVYQHGKEVALVPLQPIFEVIEVFGLAGIVLGIVLFYFGGGTLDSFRSLRKE